MKSSAQRLYPDGALRLYLVSLRLYQASLDLCCNYHLRTRGSPLNNKLHRNGLVLLILGCRVASYLDSIITCVLYFVFRPVSGALVSDSISSISSMLYGVCSC